MLQRLGATALALASATCLAVDLPDCRLESSSLVSSTKQAARRAGDSAQLLAVSAKNLRNGVDISYGKDEPVVAADLTVISVVPALIPDADIVVRNSWLLSPGFRFPAGRPLVVPKQLRLADDRVFSLVELKGGSTLFVDDTGQICNKALNSGASPNVWMTGTLSQESSGRFERQIIERETGTGSIRIVFNGVSGGVLSFQEVWVNGSTVVKSLVRNFDQFAKTIALGPFAFEVIEAANGRVTLRYEIAERGPVGTDVLSKMPLRHP
jgi:hypothetical protein